MIRRFAAAALFAALILPAAPVAADPSCSYSGGFKAMHDQIPGVIGDCLDNEYYVPMIDESGPGMAQHTANGELRWQAAGNQLTFRNGSELWSYGQNGTLGGGPLPITDGLTNRQSAMCSSIAAHHTRTLASIAAPGTEAKLQEFQDTVLDACGQIGRIRGEVGIMCFDDAMAGMLADARAPGADSLDLAARMHNRIAACVQ